ncbi:MAG: ABC transporter ATP-binding protein, partial [Verrucomicrobiae bacterium]|nr:ABC transporter ATP-binding protein [Verrucomicrobiae bacterium]
MAEPDILIEARDLAREYRLGKVTVSALRGVSLDVARGEFLVITGPSGSGKTTLLNLIGCLDQPTGGSLRFAGQDVSRMGDRELSAFRARRLGFIFQTFNLVPVLSVFENVEYPLRLGRVPRAERRERTEAMIEAVGLTGHARHRPGELSGGQRQRVAIARALVTRPDLVLADEPTANLDSVTGERIVDLMREMRERLGTSFIIATHDAMVASHACRRIAIHDGRLEGDDTIADPPPVAA